jgi:hypothetical protein
MPINFKYSFKKSFSKKMILTLSITLWLYVYLHFGLLFGDYGTNCHNQSEHVGYADQNNREKAKSGIEQVISIALAVVCRYLNLENIVYFCVNY